MDGVRWGLGCVVVLGLANTIVVTIATAIAPFKIICICRHSFPVVTCDGLSLSLKFDGPVVCNVHPSHVVSWPQAIS